MIEMPAGRYGFREAARMEWIKLRTLRSTWWTLAITAAGAIAICVVAGRGTRNGSGEDLTDNALVGLAPGLLIAGVLGVLAMTSEYSTGTIRSTLAAIPDRRRLLAAKTAVFGIVALAVGEATAFVAFFAGGAALRHGIAPPTLGQPGVLRAVLLSGTSFCLIGLLGLGLGAIVRHSPAAIGLLVGGVYIAAQLVGAVSNAVLPYLPILIVAKSLGATRPETCGNPAQCPHFLPAWTGFGVLCGYATVALLIGGWLITRRDA